MKYILGILKRSILLFNSIEVILLTISTLTTNFYICPLKKLILILITSNKLISY